MFRWPGRAEARLQGRSHCPTNEVEGDLPFRGSLLLDPRDGFLQVVHVFRLDHIDCGWLTVTLSVVRSAILVDRDLLVAMIVAGRNSCVERLRAGHFV